MAVSVLGGCVHDYEDDVVDVGEAKSDTSTTVSVSSGASVTVQFTASGDPVDIAIDCGQSANPDSVGMVFTVTSAALGQPTASAAVAGYWGFSGDVEAGTQRIKLRGKAGSGMCKVRVRTLSGSCTESATFHSPITDHTHIYVGDEVATWGDFPVSGNHWGAWAKWDTIYTKPVQRGFMLHNLEHGGIVLSHNCTGEECAANLAALRDAFGESRVIVTPDPDQPTRYAARAWRWGFASDCYDEDRMLDFVSKRFRHGREDLDANPPIPYDPTTLNVPCEDLMAAPDSCN